MGWIKRQVAEHQCKKPTWDQTPTMNVGDIWQCDECKEKWTVTKIEFEDRPCGNIWVSWGQTRYSD